MQRMQSNNTFNPMLRDPQSLFEMTATTLWGLEDLLAHELTSLGAQNVKTGRRAVYFQGDQSMLYRANYRCRLALRILVPILSFEASDTDELYKKALAFQWHDIMPIEGTFFIDTAVSSTIFTNSRYALYRLKDAIRDYDNSSSYPRRLQASDSRRASVCLHLHISEKYVTISMDSSGESLHHRGYRAGYTEAPLNEVLAAGVLAHSGYDGTTTFLDPMCGSGTFLVEAAMIATNTPAGYYRENYSFRNWMNFNLDIWNAVKKETQRIRAKFPILGRDKNFKAVGIATATVAQAGFRTSVDVEQADFFESPPPKGDVTVVMNPPYGKRIEHDNLEELYRNIGSTLKHSYCGAKVVVLASPPKIFDAIGLAHSSKMKCYNGDLPCEVRSFEIFDGTKKSYLEDKNSHKQRMTDEERNELFIQDDEPTSQSFRKSNYKGRRGERGEESSSRRFSNDRFKPRRTESDRSQHTKGKMRTERPPRESASQPHRTEAQQKERENTYKNKKEHTSRRPISKPRVHRPRGVQVFGSDFDD